MSETATLGGGCYWCFEAIFKRLEGVESVQSGYAGGHTKNPTANKVYMGNTGHAEVVQITYDPEVITYRELLEIFFVFHDPTTLNRQGNDIGDEYRSIILYHDEEQHITAADMVRNFAPSLWKDPVVTQLQPLERFWLADESMQNFYDRNPNQGYCMVIIDPKIQKLRQKYAGKLKSS